MRAYEFIFEALKPSQYRSLVKGWDKQRYADIFDNKYRIYLPLVQSKVKPNPKIEQAIRDLGYEIDDYKTGQTHKIDNPSKRKRIGQLLTDPSLIQLFANDPARAASKTDQLVVISRHPYDIAGMSTDRGWTSCMNLDDGGFKKYVPLDIKAGSVIAYLINSDDKNIEHPIARLLIKPFVNSKTKDIAFGIENKMYGSGSPEFKDVVMRWVDQINSRKELNGVFKLTSELYQDSVAQISFKKGIRNTIPKKTVKRDGTIEYKLDGELHRVDGPAIIKPNGSEEWYQNGLRHRVDGPAIIKPDGTEAWYQNGKEHRTDGPAVIWQNGEEWWQNGKKHRSGGPAVIRPGGKEFWYQHGEYHRIDGPAISYPDGYEAWYQHGELHRVDGPAVIRPDGFQAWYQHGEYHRIDSPAKIYPNGTEEYWEDGKRIK